jgi:hypothetical protein
VLPADPVWHALYGIDLTAWSLPHVMVAFSFIMIAVLATTLYIISQTPTEWRTLRALRLGDWIPLSALVFSMMILMQLFDHRMGGGPNASIGAKSSGLVVGVGVGSGINFYGDACHP